MPRETEDNSTRPTANYLALGDTMYGKINALYDVDTYKIHLRPGHVKFTLTNPVNTNFRIRVFRGLTSTEAIAEEVSTSTSLLIRSCEADIGLDETDDYYISISYNAPMPTYSKLDYTLRVVYTSLTMPLNINQLYDNRLKGLCAAVCAMDIAKYYDDDNVLGFNVDNIIDEMINDYKITVGGLAWSNVPYADFDNSERDGNIAPSVIYQKAKDSIEHGRPMMLHYYSSSNTHWVIPVAYDENSTSISTLTVCDPYTRNDETKETNTPWSLSESQSYNAHGISSFSYGYVTSSPE